MKALFVTGMSAITLLSACGLDPGVLIGKQEDNREPIVEKWQVCREKAVKLHSRSGSYACSAPEDLRRVVDHATTGNNTLTLYLNKLDGVTYPTLNRVMFTASHYESSFSTYQTASVRGECKEVTPANANGRKVYECSAPYSSKGDRNWLESIELQNPECGATATFKAVYPHPVCDSEDQNSYPYLETVYIGQTGLSAIYSSSR